MRTPRSPHQVWRFDTMTTRSAGRISLIDVPEVRDLPTVGAVVHGALRVSRSVTLSWLQRTPPQTPVSTSPREPLLPRGTRYTGVWVSLSFVTWYVAVFAGYGESGNGS